MKKYLLFLLIISQYIIAQEKATPKAVIPFSLVEDKFIFLEVNINNKPLTFYFDTGAGSSLIDANTAKKLGITPDSETEISGAGGRLKYQIALNQKVKLQEAVIDSVQLVLDDLTRLQKSFGIKFDGIIGADIMEKYITEINFDKKTLTLYPFGTKLNLNNYNENSFTFNGSSSIPIISATIQLKNGKEYTGNVRFDSGAGLTLFVNTPFKEKNQLIQQSNKVYISSSNNLSGKSIDQSIAIKSISFADNTFFNLPISLASAKSGASSDPNYLGILGNELINRFNLVLNYQTKKMYLTRNSLYNKAFHFPTSGASLSENENGEYYVSKISENSELYKKGVREDDVVISVDGITKGSAAYFMELLSRENKEMEVEIKTKSDTKKFKIKFEKLI